MRQNASNVVLLLSCSPRAHLPLCWYADKNWLPEAGRKPAERRPKPAAEKQAVAPAEAAAEAAAGRRVAARPRPSPPSTGDRAAVTTDATPPPRSPEPPRPKRRRAGRQAEPAHARSRSAATTVLQPVLLTTHGGGVQQVVLPEFDEADRLGPRGEAAERPAAAAAPHPRRRPRPRGKTSARRLPVRRPAARPQGAGRPRRIAGRAVVHAVPLRHAGRQVPRPARSATTNWKVVDGAAAGRGRRRTRSSFETELGDAVLPEDPQDLHPRPEGLPRRAAGRDRARCRGGQKEAGASSATRSPARGGLPVEGEWYTTHVPRRAGRLDGPQGHAAAAVRGRGDDRMPSAAATQVPRRRQHVQVRRRRDPVLRLRRWRSTTPTESARRRTLGLRPRRPPSCRSTQKHDPNQPYFDDVTFRAASDALDLGPGRDGRAQLPDLQRPGRRSGCSKHARAATGRSDEALVDRYQDDLDPADDHRLPARRPGSAAFANAIYWTDLVIAFTNLMHWLLGGHPHGWSPNWGLSHHRADGHGPAAAVHPEPQADADEHADDGDPEASCKPELEKLKEKYKDDSADVQPREDAADDGRTGSTRSPTMGGCLLLFAQMPIFMGLYFCLQESVFFRLEPFLWVDQPGRPGHAGLVGREHPVHQHARRTSAGCSTSGRTSTSCRCIAVGLMLHPAEEDDAAADRRAAGDAAADDEDHDDRDGRVLLQGARPGCACTSSSARCGAWPSGS